MVARWNRYGTIELKDALGHIVAFNLMSTRRIQVRCVDNTADLFQRAQSPRAVPSLKRIVLFLNQRR